MFAAFLQPSPPKLSSFWGFGHLQNLPVSVKMFASLLIAISISVLNIKSRRRDTSLYLKRHPYKVILGGIHAKHSASSLKVFICNFCFSSNASLSWLGTSFFPRVHHFVNTVYVDTLLTVSSDICTFCNKLSSYRVNQTRQMENWRWSLRNFRPVRKPWVTYRLTILEILNLTAINCFSMNNQLYIISVWSFYKLYSVTFTS